MDYNRIKVADLEKSQQKNQTLLTNDLGELEFKDIDNIIKETELANDEETQISSTINEDKKVISRLKLFNWWNWVKSLPLNWNNTISASPATQSNQLVTKAQLDLKSNDNDALHKTGNENFTGLKTVSNTGTDSTQINGFSLTNNGTHSSSQVFEINNNDIGIGARINNTSSGRGILVNNSSNNTGIDMNNTGTGNGLLVTNISSGRGVSVNNKSNGFGFIVSNSSTGQGFYANNSAGGEGIKIDNSGNGNSFRNNSSATAAGFVSNQTNTGTGLNFAGQNNLVNTFTVDKLGNINASSLNLKGETANTIASFDSNKNLKSLPLDNYPSLTEISFLKSVTSPIQAQIDVKAPSADPILTGIPTAPTPNLGTNNNQIATTEFVLNSINSGNVSIPDVSSTVTGSVNNIELQELGGVDKTIHGVRVGKGSGTAIENIMVGQGGTLSKNTTGDYNTAMGYECMVENTTGSNNTAYGEWALRSNKTGTNNTGVGVNVLTANINGTGNSAVGLNSMLKNEGGGNNTAVGIQALRDNVGVFTLQGNGWNNTAVGNSALITNISGTGNVGIGAAALSQNTTGHYNIGIGYLAGSGVKGGGNIIIASAGMVAGGGGITTGNNNVIIAPNNGNTTGVTTGSGNVILGKVNNLSPTLENNIVISNGVGNIKAQNDGTNWKFTGQINKTSLDTAPTSSTDTGILGELRITTNYIYVCTATNSWVRTALTTW